MFAEVPGFAVTVERGLFRQVKLYERAGRLFAQHGAGYVMVYAGPGGAKTSRDKLWIDQIGYDDALYVDPHGRLYTQPLAGTRQISEAEGVVSWEDPHDRAPLPPLQHTADAPVGARERVLLRLPGPRPGVAASKR